MDFEKPDPTEEGDQSPLHSMKASRRSFIVRCLAICGGTIAYLTPSVKAYGATHSISSPGPVFDITLPASYSAGGAPFSVTFSIPGHAPLPADFTPSGQVTLVASGVPNVANAVSNGMTVTSVSTNPLLPAGENCGTVTMTIPAGRIMGTLNLNSGVFTPADCLVNASTNCDTQNNLTFHVSGGTVTPASQSKCSNCFNNNTITIGALAFSSGVGSVSGVALVSFTSIAAP